MATADDTAPMSLHHVCTGCGEQRVSPPWRYCNGCGAEQFEPFREGWDESG